MAYLSERDAKSMLKMKHGEGRCPSANTHPNLPIQMKSSYGTKSSLIKTTGSQPLIAVLVQAFLCTYTISTNADGSLGAEMFVSTRAKSITRATILFVYRKVKEMNVYTDCH